MIELSYGSLFYLKLQDTGGGSTGRAFRLTARGNVMTQRFGHWAASVLCAALSTIALIRSIETSSDGSQTVLLAFLPMCFVFSGIATYSLQTQILKVQAELAQLQAKGVAVGDS